MSLTGQVALVTGGARGIGAAVVAALAEAGAAVVVGDVDETGAIDTAARAAKDHGTQALGIGMDIADRASVDAAIATTEAEVGPLSILVNNAGIDVIKPFIDSTPDEWERIIAVNLMGTFHCCQSALAVMQPRGDGAIVNLASDAGRVGLVGRSGLLRDQGRRHRVHQDARPRGRPLRHSGQLREPRAHRHRVAGAGRGGQPQPARRARTLHPDAARR